MELAFIPKGWRRKTSTYSCTESLRPESHSKFENYFNVDQATLSDNQGGDIDVDFPVEPRLTCDDRHILIYSNQYM